MLISDHNFWELILSFHHEIWIEVGFLGFWVKFFLS